MLLAVIFFVFLVFVPLEFSTAVHPGIPCAGNCLSDSKVYFKRLFDYLKDASDSDEFCGVFFGKLVDVFEGDETRFPHFLERLFEYSRLRQGHDDDDNYLLRKLFTRLFEKLWERYEAGQDEYLEEDLPDIDQPTEISSIVSTKMFKKLFEKFFKKLKEDILENGLDDGSLLEFIQKLYDFYETTVEDENGDGRKLGMLDLMQLLFDLLDTSSRRIIRPDCLPIEINDEDVKCEKKGSTTKCKVKKKNKITETKGTEKYTYKEESKIYEDKTWDDLTPKQQEVKEKRWMDEKGPDSKGKVKIEEKNSFEGYLPLETDDGEPAVMKFKVQCKYKLKAYDYTDVFARTISYTLANNHIMIHGHQQSSKNEEKRRKNDVDESQFFHSLFDHMKSTTKKDEKVLYIPKTMHEYDRIINTLEVHLDNNQIVLDNEKEEEEEELLDPILEEEKEKDDDGNRSYPNNNEQIGLPEVYGADFTISIVILCVVMFFIIVSVFVLVCCTCCFIYFSLREKCIERENKKNEGRDSEGYTRLVQENNNVEEEFELDD